LKRLLTLVIALIALLTLTAAAEDAPTGGLSVSLVFPPDTPAKSYFSYGIAPGATVEGALDLTNNARSALHVDLYPADAYNTPDGALTGPLLGEPSKNTGNWLTVDTSAVTLKPGQNKRVKFKMTVPADTAAGDYFGFIFVQPSPAEQAAPSGAPGEKAPVSINVKVVQRLGVCIWERVPGSLQNVLKVGTLKKIIDRGRLFLELELSNEGNTYLKPTGSWSLKSPSGEVVTSQIPNELGYILPGHPMKLRIPIQTTRPLVRGEYHLEYDLKYADQEMKDQLPVTLP
jgi:hypothetical protein